MVVHVDTSWRRHFWSKISTKKEFNAPWSGFHWETTVRCNPILFSGSRSQRSACAKWQGAQKKKKKAMKTKTENETMMISLPLGLRCVSHPPQSAWTFLLYWKACTICTLACFPCDIPAHEPDLNDDSHMYYYNRCIVRVRPSVTPFLCALESARLMFAFLRSGFAWQSPGTTLPNGGPFFDLPQTGKSICKGD